MKAEGDVVASTKEAEQAGQQLIKERETLAEKIQKLEVPFYEDDNTPVDGRNLHQADCLPEAAGHEERSDF